MMKTDLEQIAGCNKAQKVGTEAMQKEIAKPAVGSSGQNFGKTRLGGTFA